MVSDFARCLAAISIVASGCTSMYTDPGPIRDLPKASDVRGISVTCDGLRRPFTDRQEVAPYVDFLERVNNDWKAWGPITLPAGTGRAVLELNNGTYFVFWAPSDRGAIWTHHGHRQLSDQERSVMSTLLPQC